MATPGAGPGTASRPWSHWRRPRHRKPSPAIQSLGVDIYASFIVRPDFSKEDFQEFRKYWRELGLSFATFSLLTPLPGTDFYEEVKNRLVNCNYDHFDFFHTLLPTR